MDYDKLYYLAEQNKFTDLKLILKSENGIEELSMNLHKTILYTSCPYFEGMFENFKEKDESTFTMIVPNVFVIHDIIASFYQQKTKSGDLPEWKYPLEFIRCSDYLGLKYDPDTIYHLKVPPEGFELLLKVIAISGWTDDGIAALYNNLPENYDISKLPQKILARMQEIGSDYEIITISKHEYDRNNRISKFDLMNNTIICTIDDTDDVFYNYLTNQSFNGKYLALGKKGISELGIEHGEYMGYGNWRANP